jgi:MYXO-CTERM domain-containing protein
MLNRTTLGCFNPSAPSPRSRPACAATRTRETTLTALLMTGLMVLSATAASAATITVTDTANGAFTDVALDPFSYTVQNADSTLVIGFYVDHPNPVTSVSFGGVAADDYFNNDRVWIAYWDSPVTGTSTLDINGFIVGTGGGGADLLVGAYELAGVDLSATVTSSTGGSIITPTDNEFVISFAGQNNDTDPSPNGTSIIDTDVFALNSTDISTGAGGGAVGGGAGLAGLAGSQDVSWPVSGGIVSYSFQATIPEPASLAMGLAGLTLIAARRRRSA